MYIKSLKMIRIYQNMAGVMTYCVLKNIILTSVHLFVVALSYCQQDAQYWWPFKFLSFSRSTLAFNSGMKGIRKITVYNHGV